MIKNNLYYFLLFLITVLFFSCRPKNKEAVIIIELEKNLGKEDLKFSDVAQNIQAIPLETNDSCLLPDHFEIWVGKNNIITLAQNSIHLFHINGRHIKKLAQKGRGPEEYQFIKSWAVNETQNRLYYSDPQDRENIKSIDLTNKTFGKLPMGVAPPDKMVIDDDHSFVFCSSLEFWNTEKKEFTYSPNEISYLSETGHLIYAIPTAKTNWERKELIIPGIRKNYLCKIGDHITYSRTTSDTIFQINKRQKIPLAIIKLKNPLKSDKPQGSLYWIIMESSQDLFLHVQEIEVQKHDNSSVSFLFSDNRQYVRINKKDKTVHQINRFHLDIFDAYTSFPIENKTSNNKISYKISALEIKNMVEKKKEAGEELTPRLKELSEELKEEDNPVIIVGTLK